MDVETSKVVCLVILLLDTWILGWMPYFLVRQGAVCQSQRAAAVRAQVISYFNCFAGGVFLGACLLHLLVEGRETLQDYFDEANISTDYPVYETVAFVGFILIALVEQLAHIYLHNEPSTNDDHAHGHHHDDRQLQQQPQQHVTEERPGINHNNVTNEGSYGAVAASVSSERIILIKDREDRHDHNHTCELVEVAGQMQATPMRAFLLLIALSFHTVFDGLSVGLQTSQSTVWEMFVAIVIHKSMVALCLGLQLFLAFQEKPLRAFLWVFFFSLIAPLGVVIGILVTSDNVHEESEKLVSGLLQGLATGTFMYVTFFEILKEELIERRGVLRLALVVLGFGGMALAKFLDKD